MIQGKLWFVRVYWGAARLLCWSLDSNKVCLQGLYIFLQLEPGKIVVWAGVLLVASGKLGVVRAPGKKPRLIGDGSVSGAN